MARKKRRKKKFWSKLISIFSFTLVFGIFLFMFSLYKYLSRYSETTLFLLSIILIFISALVLGVSIKKITKEIKKKFY